MFTNDRDGRLTRSPFEAVRSRHQLVPALRSPTPTACGCATLTTRYNPLPGTTQGGGETAWRNQNAVDDNYERRDSYCSPPADELG